MDTVKKQQSAFTLIEVTVALGILAAGLLAVAAAQLYAMRGGSSGRHGSAAAAFANTQLENFQRTDFTDAALNQTAGWVPVGGQQVFTTVQADPADLVEMTYTVQWRITDVTPDLKAIDVRVTWAERNRPNRDVTISTMRHNDPLTGGDS
jgi:prepilin-type N-terminal cleavage/methylation domain-containing protein